jgi:UDPglucose--hexose-1-phosphate uridylyltransferase
VNAATGNDPHYRIDPLTGDVVFIVADRQARPNLPSGGCPFCPGGLEAPEPYDVRWFPNRWPALPDERCEIVLYTPRHDAAFWELSPVEARRVIDLWAERTHALGSRPDVDYVLVFENRGPEVGATIAHPHGQIYAFDQIPPRAVAELSRPATPALGDDAVGDRLVAAVGDWRAWVPWAANWPFEILVAPRGRVTDLPSLDGAGRDQLAAVLGDVLARLDRLFAVPTGGTSAPEDLPTGGTSAPADAVPIPYMMWFHQRPTDGGDWPEAWLHLHIAPLYRSPDTQRFVAAGELGSHVYFNPIDPVAAAARLREV